jgi:hypothetical protein
MPSTFAEVGYSDVTQRRAIAFCTHHIQRRMAENGLASLDDDFDRAILIRLLMADFGWKSLTQVEERGLLTPAGAAVFFSKHWAFESPISAWIRNYDPDNPPAVCCPDHPVRGAVNSD